MKQLLFACLVFIGCNNPEPTQLVTSNLNSLDTVSSCYTQPLGLSVVSTPIVSKQDIKKLNGKGPFAGGYTIRYSSPDPETGYSNLSVGYDTGVTLDSTSTSGSIRFAGYSGVTYNNLGISNRYFLDTSIIEKPVVLIVHDSITSHLEFYPAQVTYVKRFYVRGYYYNYDTDLQYQPVDTSLVSSRVILVDGFVKPSNLFIIE